MKILILNSHRIRVKQGFISILNCPKNSVFGTNRTVLAHLWEAIRENYFYNEVFDSLDKVMDTLCEGLNYFNSVPETLKSMTYFPHLRITF